jgi:hypothetical protein
VHVPQQAQQAAAGDIADGDLVHVRPLSDQAVSEVAGQLPAGGVPGFGLRPVGTDARGGSRRVQYSAGQLEQARLVVALRATVRTTSATVGRCAQPSER